MANDELKGQAVQVFSGQKTNALGDTAVDCTGYNAVSIQAFVRGSSPSADLSLEGAPSSPGPYVPISTVNVKTGLDASAIFDVLVGASWIKVRLANMSGSFDAGGFEIKVTPFKTQGPRLKAA